MAKVNEKEKTAFLVYFELGKERTHEKVVEHYAGLGRQKGHSLRTIEGWSSKYNWRQKLRHKLHTDANAYQRGKEQFYKEWEDARKSILRMQRLIIQIMTAVLQTAFDKDENGNVSLKKSINIGDIKDLVAVIRAFTSSNSETLQMYGSPADVKAVNLFQDLIKNGFDRDLSTKEVIEIKESYDIQVGAVDLMELKAQLEKPPEGSKGIDAMSYEEAKKALDEYRSQN